MSNPETYSLAQELASKPLVPSGTFGNYGKHAHNTEISLRAANRVVGPTNRPESILKNLVRSAPRRIHYGEGRWVTALRPSGPYSQDSILVTAVDIKDRYQRPGVSKTIYEYATEQQEGYYREILANMLAMHELTPEEDRQRYSIFATENVIDGKTDHRRRTPRTIDDAHTQINRFLHTDIDTNSHVVIPHLTEEQEILQRNGFVDRFSSRVKRLMELQDHPMPNFQTRAVAPYGYQVVLTEDIRHYIAHPEQLVDMLRGHHDAYLAVADRYQKQAEKKVKAVQDNPDRIIPHSYRQYISLAEIPIDDQQPEAGTRLTPVITFNPIFWSTAGSMEAAGIKLDRSEEYPERKPYIAPHHVIQRASELIEQHASNHNEPVEILDLNSPIQKKRRHRVHSTVAS